jgi:hypothetical protein
MMQKMMGQQEKGSSCLELMSQCFDPKEIGGEVLETMSQMMASCCGPQEESEADTQRA